MNRDLRQFVPLLLALGLFAVVVLQTAGAYRRAGRLGAPATAQAVFDDPYARLEALLAGPDAGVPAGLRDPFGRVAPVVVQPVRVVRPPVETAGPRPVLTAIVADNQGRTALIRFNQRSYTVRAGDVFADFQVVDISASQVVVDSGRERLVLHLPPKGP